MEFNQKKLSLTKQNHFFKGGPVQKKNILRYLWYLQNFFLQKMAENVFIIYSNFIQSITFFPNKQFCNKKAIFWRKEKLWTSQKGCSRDFI